jgi:hypothetical protein
MSFKTFVTSAVGTCGISKIVDMYELEAKLTDALLDGVRHIRKRVSKSWIEAGDILLCS